MTEMKQRDAYFDNIKAFLIVMVVLGHLIEPFRWTHPLYHGIYTVIYSFHMPLFIFVSGYFSKNREKSRAYALRDFLLIYILFNTLYQVVTGGVEAVNVFQPTFVYWYLLSMFFWKVFLQDVIKLRWCGVVMVGVALYIGDFEQINRFMSLSRTFVFFPYFLLGYMTKESWIEQIKKIPRWLAFPLFVVTTGSIGYVLNRQIISPGLLLGADAYKTLKLELWQGVGSRLLLYGIAIVVGILILNLIPRRHHFFTAFGKSTMPIYLGHVYVILWLAEVGVPTMNPYKGMLFFVVLACIVVVVLGNPWTHRVYEKVMALIKRLVIKP